MSNKENYIIREIQKRYAQGIINIFETGNPYGDYGKVTLIKNDKGGLSYGKSQTTLSSGNLYVLIKNYVSNGGEYDDKLKPYLSKLRNKDTSLNNDNHLKRILEKAGDDPIMKRTQDIFFDRRFWKPAVEIALRFNCYMPFSTMVIYDSNIHGSWRRIAKKTEEKIGKCSEVGEVPWISEYIKVRRDWLANHSNKVLHPTVYRMDTFLDLMKDKNWILVPPFIVRDKEIFMEKMKDIIEEREEAKDKIEKEESDAHAEDDDDNLIMLADPYQQGKEIKIIQSMLADLDYYSKNKIDGIYGPNTEKAVIEFQKDHDLIVDGIVGSQTGSELFEAIYSNGYDAKKFRDQD